MGPERLNQILGRISQTSVAVVGDFCLDAYWMLDLAASELSVETGKSTQPVRQQRYSLGGAGNVSSNLAALGVRRVAAVGIIGDDIFGREMIRQLTEVHVDAEQMLIQGDGWSTPVYGKPHLEEEEQPRIDFGMFNELRPETEARLIEQLRAGLASAEAVIINHQLRRSIYSEKVLRELDCLVSADPEKPFIVDSRYGSDLLRNAYLKLNLAEMSQLAGVDLGQGETPPTSELATYVAAAAARTQARGVFVTLGQRGLLVSDGREAERIPGILIPDRTDPVGAGDAAVSVIAASLAAGANLQEAAELANFAAAVTVRKLFQCGTASPTEIRQIAASPDYIYSPDLADDPRRAQYFKDTEIEIIARPRAGGIKHAIFDHDGTISTLRQGWEQVMEPMMVRAIFGESFDRAGPKAYRRVAERVREFIDRSTGVQTISQMQRLVEMVKELGYVPQEAILDRFAYKEVYNRSLMETVEKRVGRLLSGQLAVEDFTIKGAVGFLRSLRERGIRLYLTSGTDESDARREAELLGYADLFDGGIYGAVGDVGSCSKQMVLDRILGGQPLSGLQIACFGDGPVEIRETKRRGGIAIGIASDEIRRFGPNLRKRIRLIQAGADFIAPDFSQGKALLELLFA